MSQKSNVRNQYNKVSTAISKIQTEMNALNNGEISNIKSYWKDAGGTAFLKQHETTNGDIKKVITKLNRIKQDLSTLESNVQRADEEIRRKILEEQRRAAESKNKSRK